MTGSPVQALKTRLAEIHNLDMASTLLRWDERVYMPPGGAHARGEQRATLSKISHALLTSNEMAGLLEVAEREVGDTNGLSENISDEAALVRIARRNFDRAVRLPEALVLELARTRSLAYSQWLESRLDGNFAHFAPWLEKLLDLQRQAAQCYGYKERMYDALFDHYEPGMTSSSLDPIFEELKAAIIPLARELQSKLDTVSNDFLFRDYNLAHQREFIDAVVTDCGFDWSRGRQDTSVHPFCTNFSSSDVRITTRYSQNDLRSALFGSLHEMGHALYEQGTAPELDGTPLSGAVSLGVHESQSRLWENLVGRSRPFWSHYYPKLQQAFPDQLSDVTLEQFYRGINRLSTSLIRVAADEVTYDLHIILRYEMENELLEGSLSVADAPDAWNAKMESYLGVVPPTAKEGILQDIHWSAGAFGNFPTYTIGNILSVQLWEKAIEVSPQIPKEIAEGQFGSLLGWLRENVHRSGRKLEPQELIQHATGSPLNVKPYTDYLRRKFSEIYEI
jgi:carboxypeptidase Taq